MKPTTKQRVFHLLRSAMRHHQITSSMGELLVVKQGWIPQWVLSSIAWCGSTEGKRRFRELRNDPKLHDHYVFETKKEGHDWYYRIRTREQRINADMIEGYSYGTPITVSTTPREKSRIRIQPAPEM
jgi:hypothetical protein